MTHTSTTTLTCSVWCSHNAVPFPHLQYKHEVGRAVVHLGARRHGADDIHTGERNNLIIWNWNSAYRAAGGNQNREMQKEGAEPSEMCVSFTHDRDYAAYKPFADGARGREQRATNRRTSWCPRGQTCYDGMDAVLAKARRERDGAHDEDDL